MERDPEVGARRTRREDAGLVTGETKFTDDLLDSSSLHAAILRSRFGHAKLLNIDTDSAQKLAGVIDIFTWSDIAASESRGLIKVPASLAKTLPDSVSVPHQKATELPILARNRVRFVGQPISVVIAEDRYIARTAADMIKVEYERLPAVITVDDALEEDAPVLHETFENNLALDWQFGETETVQRILSEADHVIELENTCQRLIANPMEPRACFVKPDSNQHQLTIEMATQVPHRVRGRIAETLGVSEDYIRVKAPAVGGGFGAKGNRPYPEEIIISWCARHLGRSIKWVGVRSESHQADCHGRDIYTQGQLALDVDGKILAYHVDGKLNLGGYLGWEFTPAMNIREQLSNLYDIPIISGDFLGAFTNKAPIGPYRGAGTPIAIVLIERLMHEAANQLGIDPAELRRRNLIPADEFPFETAVGIVYDSGNYEPALEQALELIDYEDFRERQTDFREEGRYLGIGICGCVKKTVVPYSPGICKVGFDENATVTAFCETADQGQGHETTFAQLLADELVVAYDDITIKEGDTEDLPTGYGTFACRSAPVVGSALQLAAQDIRDQAKHLAALEFEAAVDDVGYDDGQFFVRGAVDRAISIRELAERSFSHENLPNSIQPGFETTTSYEPGGMTHPFGFHIAIVEVDPTSGEFEIHRYVAVDDVGVQLIPLLVEGQIIGGIAQGLGQALYEHAVYDKQGTLQTSSFTDYAMPRAMHLPEITTGHTVTPSPNNPLGAKGAGESGNNGAPPAVMNAIIDALRPFGVTHLDSPITPETIWHAVSSVNK